MVGEVTLEATISKTSYDELLTADSDGGAVRRAAPGSGMGRGVLPVRTFGEEKASL